MADAPIMRVTLFVPGAPPSLDAWKDGLVRAGLALEGAALHGTRFATPVAVEWIENDGGFGEAFAFGNVAQDVVAAIDSAPSALALSLPGDLREARVQAVALVKALRAAGGLAVRVEQSKLGWEIGRWLELMESGDASAWHRAVVTFLQEAGTLESCGMHAFSLPDVLIPMDGEVDELQNFASVLNVYQLEEDPVLLSGQTFAPDSETPRRVLERWPATLYPQDHPCHNPYGVFRFGPAGGKARPQRELSLVFTPTLASILTALEAELGRPLTQTEAEKARDQAACIAMKHSDAQQLERSRGYADVNPEQVGQQWQQLRTQAGIARLG
jgi:hypothetical protein